MGYIYLYGTNVLHIGGPRSCQELTEQIKWCRWLSDYREYSMPNPTFGCTQ